MNFIFFCLFCVLHLRLVAPCIECYASSWWHGYFSRMQKIIAVESASGQTTVGIDPQLIQI
ncbi:unnamed protein product [Brassica napus]|uniref:(rape) hypothetical protein n=1 Tax=Brassica napus TaxID=3708 RepID=A0A816P4E1_BRANA|nr:unnamed protein product [Brassica napus]